MKHRLICFALALAVACSSLPAPALALDEAPLPAASSASSGDTTPDSAPTDDASSSSMPTDETDPTELPANSPMMAPMSEGTLSYVDETGVVRSYDGTYTEVTGDTLDWTEGWYLASGDVTLSDRVTVSGNVNLILADGASLTAPKGMEAPEGSSLTLWAQSTDESTMGKLIAGAEANNAAIGGGNGGSGGSITINGGNIQATGGSNAAAIGGGNGGSGGNITINGGTVNARTVAGAAIGGGLKGSGGVIAITGGTIYANSGPGAGIGGGERGSGGTIDISGGTVTATGKGGAGIGGGEGAGGGNITISGGTVTATALNVAAGIGGGFDNGADDTSYAGAVTPTVNGSGAGIGSGGAGASGTVTITGGTVTATGGEQGAGIGGGRNVTGGTVTISGGVVIAIGGSSADDSDIGSDDTYIGADDIGVGAGGTGVSFSTGTNGSAVIFADTISDTSGQANWDCILFDSAKTSGTAYGDITLNEDFTLESGQTLTVNGTLTNSANMTVSQGANLVNKGTLTNNGKLTNNGTFDNQGTFVNNGTFTGNAPQGNPAMVGTFYLDENGSRVDVVAQKLDNATALSGGWYVVTGNDVKLTDLNLSGDVNLILADGAHLTLDGNLFMVGWGGTLTIWAQSTDASTMGSLTAEAGIPVGLNNSLVIHGGNITATGSDSGPNIQGICAGNVTITGGNVTATGSNGGAGIQGTQITISGGTVTATGSNGSNGTSDAGAGIGSSNSGFIDALVVTISGGTVTATGGEGAPDIGDQAPSADKFSTGQNGTAVIHADNINGQTGADQWSCRVYSLDGGSLTIYGDYTLTEDLTVEKDQTLTFYHDSSSASIPSLTVAEGATLHVYGTFDNQGDLVNNGSVRIYKGGTYTGGNSRTSEPVRYETDYRNDAGELTTVWAQKLTTGAGSIAAEDWYVVTEDLKANLQLTIGNAHVNLILADGVTFTNSVGISFTHSDSTLDIWAQSTGDSAGKMDIKGSGEFGKLAIQGNGDLAIHGGDVTVSMPNDPNLPAAGTRCVDLSGGNLTVTGGSLTAKLYKGSGTFNGTGDLSAGTVTISGGIVEAGTISGTFSTGTNGHAVITAEIIDTSNKSDWDCILFPSFYRNGQVYGNVTLAQDFLLMSGLILTIPKGTSLTVPDTVTLTNGGHIQVEVGGAYNGNPPELAPVEYQISWDIDGKTTESYMAGGAALIPPADPVKTGDAQYTYTFAGWDPEVPETVTKPGKYTAKFTQTTNQYTVSAASGEGYSVEFENYTENTLADYGTTITFRVELAPGYSGTAAFAVKANGAELTAQNGIYSVNLAQNTTLTVEGVADTTAPGDLTVRYGTHSFKEFLNTVTFGLFFKDTVTVTFSATDAGSGVASFTYDLGNGPVTIPADSAGTATITVAPGFKGHLTDVKATDNKGNASSPAKAYESFAVERTAPTAPAVDTGTYTGTWSTTGVTVTLSGSSATSGILKYQYSADGGSTWRDLTATQSTPATAEEPFNALEAKLTVSEPTNTTYRFRAVSNAGNVSGESTVKLLIDPDAPTLTADGDTESYLTGDTVILTATAGLSGVTRVEVKKDGAWIELPDYEDGYPVTENGTYTFRVTNGAGATAEASVTYNKLDAAKPTLTLDTHGYTEGAWATGDVTLTATAHGNVAPVTVEYKTDGDWQALNGALTVNTDTAGTTYTFRAVSASGVASDETVVTVKRDASSPEGTITIGENTFKKWIHDITFGLFFNKSTEVTFSAADETSGVAGVEYIRSETLLTEDDLKTSTAWTAYSGAIAETAADAKAFVYYGKVTDNAGNVTVFGADGVIFDTAAPVIAGATDGGTYYTTQTVTVTDVNPDTLTLNGEPVTSPVTLPGDTDAVYTLTATDKAGNETRITVTMKSLSSLETPLEGLTPDSVTSQDKDKLEQTLDEVNDLLQSGVLTEEEKGKLEDTQSKIEQMLDALDKAQSAGSTENIDKVTSVTPDNVKPGDRDDLEAAKEDLENALKDHGGNYTDEERAPLEEALNRIESALESLDKVQTAQDAVTALPDTVEPDDLETIGKIEAAKEQYDGLTEHEKELLGTAAGDKLNQLLAAASAYKILSGDDSTWTQGGADGLTITANGSPARLKELRVDGKTLAAENYTVRSGSTIVTLAPGYLNSLAAGTHTLTFVYENGQTSATFTVAAAAAGGGANSGTSGASGTSGTAGTTGVPQTGDTSNLMLWLCLLTASALGLLALALVKRKRA